MYSSRMRTARLVDRIPACTAQGGVCPGVSAWGVCPAVFCPGGCLRGGGVADPPGPEADTLPVDRMTDRCKNITLR